MRGAKPSILPTEREEEFKIDATTSMSYEELQNKYSLKNKSQAQYLKKKFGIINVLKTIDANTPFSNTEITSTKLMRSYLRDCENIDVNAKREKEKFKKEYLKEQETERTLQDMRKKLRQ